MNTIMMTIINLTHTWCRYTCCSSLRSTQIPFRFVGRVALGCFRFESQSLLLFICRRWYQ